MISANEKLLSFVNEVSSPLIKCLEGSDVELDLPSRAFISGDVTINGIDIVDSFLQFSFNNEKMEASCRIVEPTTESSHGMVVRGR